MSNNVFFTNLLRPEDEVFNSFSAVINHNSSVIDVFQVENTDSTLKVRLKVSIFRQHKHIFFLEITINDNVSNIHAYNLYTENWKTYSSQQKMIDKLHEMFKVFSIFTFYLHEEELNKSIVFLAENIKNQLLNNKLAK